MGYDYCFYLSVNDPDEFGLHKNRAIRVYNRLKLRNWFPVFGLCGHGGSFSYGTGPTDKLFSEFAMFTTEFPNFIFKLWMTYWDNTNLYVSEVKGNSLLSTFNKDYESVELTPTQGLRILIRLSSDNMEIENDITDWFV